MTADASHIVYRLPAILTARHVCRLPPLPQSFDVTKFPKYFQMGTVVDNPQDFYGGRLPNSQRKGTLTEQLLADEQVTQVGGERDDWAA